MGAPHLYPSSFRCAALALVRLPDKGLKASVPPDREELPHEVNAKPPEEEHRQDQEDPHEALIRSAPGEKVFASAKESCAEEDRGQHGPRKVDPHAPPRP